MNEVDQLESAEDAGVVTDNAEGVEEAMLAQGYEKVVPDKWRYDYDRITSLEAVREYVKELNIVIELFPGTPLEEIGRDSEQWIKVEEEDDTITDI